MERQQSNRLMQWASRAAIAVALTLVAVKAYAWWASASAAMLGSMTDSALDLAASVVTLMAVKTAILPPDHDHRFGHGKAEALAGLFQAAIMAGSALFLALEAIQSLWQPAPLKASSLIIQVSLLAIALSLVLVFFQAYVVKRTRSLAVAGDHLHYKGDLLLNFGVIIAAYAGAQGWLYADGIFALMIAAYIIYGSIDVARPAVDMLMDAELPDEDREAIFNLVLGNSDVIGMHKLKTRLSGRDTFIQMHIEVDGNLSVKAAHLISGEVEAIVGEAYPDAEILIHIDPPSEKSTDLTLGELKDEDEKK